MWTFRFYKPHSFLRSSVVSYLKNIFISLFLISLLPAQEAGNTVAVLVFEGRGISLSESTTLTDRFRTALADIGYVRIVDQKTTGSIYVLEEEQSCRIKVASMTHLRLTDFPSPEKFDILAPVIDRRLWGQKKVVRILDGLIPSSYLHLNVINYYLEFRRIGYL